MKLTLACIPCIVNNFIRVLKEAVFSEEQEEKSMRSLLNFLAKADYGQSPPALAREMHSMIRKVLNNPDPYKNIKEVSNAKILDLYQEISQMVTKADDPVDMALRLAVAGNVIDFGAQHQFSIRETIKRVIQAKLAIDDSSKLKEDLDSSNTVLYIADNCGEIVFDKLFIETIKHRNLYFAVRGAPIINDATMEDAKTIKIHHLAKVLTTGDDAPGVIWERCSHEFRHLFKEADVIISKGQGNLEGLLERNQNIYFLLVVKCDLVAEHLGVSTGDFVVKRSEYFNK